MTKTKSDNLVRNLPDLHLSSSNHHFTTPLRFLFVKNQYHLIVQDAHSFDALPQEIHHHISNDLTLWSPQPTVYALSVKEPYKSGTVIVDSKNTSGLGTSSKSAWVLIYTSPGITNTLHLMSSTDGGNTWVSHKSTLLDFKKNKANDPFIFWHEQSSKWIMVLTFPEEFKTKFYTSKNLLKWEYFNDFGGHPSFKNLWEHVCLFPALVQNVPGKEKWVLVVSFRGVYSGVRYFIGDFDGKTFLCDHALDTHYPMDYGKDIYCPRVCTGVYPKRNFFIASATNTAYASEIPIHHFQNLITLPKEILINKELDGTFRLIQKFIPELASLRKDERNFPKSPVTNEVEWDMDLSETMEFHLQLDSHKGCTIEFDFSTKTKLLLTWDVLKHQLVLDRSARPLAFHPEYSSLDIANVTPGHTIDVQIIIDKNIIAIIADKGKVTITSLFFAANPLQRFRIIGKQFAAAGTVWKLLKKK